MCGIDVRVDGNRCGLHRQLLSRRIDVADLATSHDPPNGGIVMTSSGDARNDDWRTAATPTRWRAPRAQNPSATSGPSGQRARPRAKPTAGEEPLAKRTS